MAPGSYACHILNISHVDRPNAYVASTSRWKRVLLYFKLLPLKSVNKSSQKFLWLLSGTVLLYYWLDCRRLDNFFIWRCGNWNNGHLFAWYFIKRLFLCQIVKNKVFGDWFAYQLLFRIALKIQQFLTWVSFVYHQKIIRLFSRTMHFKHLNFIHFLRYVLLGTRLIAVIRWSGALRRFWRLIIGLFNSAVVYIILTDHLQCDFSLLIRSFFLFNFDPIEWQSKFRVAGKCNLIIFSFTDINRMQLVFLNDDACDIWHHFIVICLGVQDDFWHPCKIHFFFDKKGLV